MICATLENSLHQLNIVRIFEAIFSHLLNIVTSFFGCAVNSWSQKREFGKPINIKPRCTMHVQNQNNWEKLRKKPQNNEMKKRVHTAQMILIACINNLAAMTVQKKKYCECTPCAAFHIRCID